MEALCVRASELTLERDGGEGKLEASVDSATEEEESEEDSEAEPPPVVRRKVSFADAFGLDLVSVKEFDNAEAAEAEDCWPEGGDGGRLSEELYLTCLFTVPLPPEELDLRLQTQMLELESIELLPGTTTLRGIIRVVNLCYAKNIYVRITLDQWSSHFDMPADYIPGSSDMRTDRFTFSYTLTPPFEKEGSRVEFCLRYETPAGTFWANNKGMNYVLFCHQKQQRGKENVAQDETKTKRSCLKAQRSGGAEEKTREPFDSALVPAESEVRPGVYTFDGKKTVDPEFLLRRQEEKTLVESVKSRRRAARLARVQDFFSQRRQQLLKECPCDSGSGREASQAEPPPRSDCPGVLRKCPKTRLRESPQVLTYHQIPLLPLDWNSDTAQQWGPPDAGDIWTGRAKMTLSGASEQDPASANDTWEPFPDTAGGSDNKAAAVSDVWQVFLNGPSCMGHSDVPESEWLQTAASVSPSNDKRPRLQYSAGSQEFEEFQMGKNALGNLHTLAACQPLSDSCETLSATVASNTEARQPAEACDSSLGDDSAAAQEAPQRSQTDSETDTAREFSLKRAAAASKDSVGSPGECHELTASQQEAGGMMGGGIGGDEPFTLHTADSVTSSGELETTDMTAVPESPNASADDRISQGARQDEGLSSRGGGEVTGTPPDNAASDTLAFRETIRQETKDAARYVFSASRQALEEGITMNYTERKAESGLEVFKQREIRECGRCRRCGDEKTTLKVEGDDFDPYQMTQQEFEPIGINTDGGMEEHKNEEGEVLLVDGEQIGTGTRMALEASFGLMGNKSAKLESCDVPSKPNQPGGGQGDQLKSETDEDVVKTSEEASLGPGGKSVAEAKPSERSTTESTQINKIFQINRDTVGPCLVDKLNLDPSEGKELRWAVLGRDLRGQKEDVKSEKSSREVTTQKSEAKRGSSADRMEEDTSQENERTSTGELTTEGTRELEVESPQKWQQGYVTEEEELSAEVEGPPREREQASDGTKDLITAESTELVERFGEDLVRRILEEVFVQQVKASSGSTADAMGGGVTDCQLLEKDPFDTFCSDQTDWSFRQGVEESHTMQSSSLEPRSQSYFPCKRQDTPYLAPPTEQTTQALTKSKQSHVLLWWSILYTIAHITRLIICTLLVSGFFLVIFLYDFPAFFALYVFSMCWWIFKWKRHQKEMNKGVAG
ncbi:protein phosphatase 1 regulatory subunit 3A isoform X2 [Oryzias latipes]|uniref:protein phosphatase 1 regulatory subunit 3A isoform X2 n=1 Tax=Oryzias latipes TaxID=8090 RepID=UPI0005CBFBBB|nr:protein phosphatase 1 regulatory subunit 3A isoform X2 [Oryzias latipes]